MTPDGNMVSSHHVRKMACTLPARFASQLTFPMPHLRQLIIWRKAMVFNRHHLSKTNG